jgi:hypothetical protein
MEERKMERITFYEAMDYVQSVDLGGITLTEAGRNAAKAILERRRDWTDAHALMLGRLERGEVILPHKLTRLVNRTRLGDALDLARNLNRKHIKNQKAKARRKAARTKKAAATANTATARAAA